ncbi:MAG: NAD(P)-dependent oxidoreductase [Deltaproteobacteria bacterium]|nr:NAD(P)-dependent oxidoreductase [Deltaproteobacteria bacterium]
MGKPRIGFIGIGVMGAPMSGHIAKAGYALTLHDINRAAAESVAAAHEGVRIVETPMAVAEASDIVITMLPSGKYVREVALGDSGLIEGFQAGSLLLDTSSSQPWLTVETAMALKEKGVDMVDAPVSGARAGAESAELVFMAGGEEGPVSRISPILQILGKQVFHLGPVGAGHTMKCVNNLVSAMIFMATTEALTIGKQFGLDPDVMTDVLNVSTGGSWISQTQIKQRITSRKFDDAFRLELMIKDMGIAMELANSKKLPLPLSALGQHLWQAAGRYAEKGSNISHLVHWIEHMTGIEITSGKGDLVELDERLE